MKLNEFVINEGWGDALKSVASGFTQGTLKGITPTQSSNSTQMKSFIDRYVQQINTKIRQAIGSGAVSVAPGHATTQTPNKWDPHNGTLTSGKNGKIYQRMSTGEWKLAGPGGEVYAKKSAQSRALEKERLFLISPAGTPGAAPINPGSPVDLAEGTYTKLNKIFEQVIAEAGGVHSVYSISDFLQAATKEYLGNMYPADPGSVNIIKRACDTAQSKYKKPADWMKALNALGKTVYSVSQK